MTTKLTSLNHNNLRHAEASQFLTRFLDDLDKSGLDLSADQVLVDLVARLRTDLRPLARSLDQVRSNVKSADIAKADEQRDRDFQALKDSLRPYRTSREAAEQAAYTSLKTLFDQHKLTAKTNYEAQTALLTTLLGQLASAPYADQMTELGMTKFANKLRTSQAAFEAVFSARSQEELAKPSYDVKALRKTAFATYQNLTDYTAVLARVKDEKVHTDLLAVLNNSRAYYADLLARR